jgi:hypothetical protein
MRKAEEGKDSYYGNQTQLNQNLNTTNNIPLPLEKIEVNNENNIVWLESQKFGLKYPKGVEWYEGYLVTDLGKFAEARFTYDGAIISWGGQNTSCMNDADQYKVFQYGVSTIACIKGLTAGIGLENVRDTISQKALNIFGDFVLKNK